MKMLPAPALEKKETPAQGAPASGRKMLLLHEIEEKIAAARGNPSLMEAKEAKTLLRLLQYRRGRASCNGDNEKRAHVGQLINELREMHPELKPKEGGCGTRMKEDEDVHDFVSHRYDWVWRYLREKPLKEISKGDRGLMIALLQKSVGELNTELKKLQKRGRDHEEDISIAHAEIKCV